MKFKLILIFLFFFYNYAFAKTKSEIRFEKDLSQPVTLFMTPKDKLITIHQNASREEVINVFRQHRVEKLLVVDDQFALKGMYTVRDILKSETTPQATKNKEGQLQGLQSG